MSKLREWGEVEKELFAPEEIAAGRFRVGFNRRINKG